MYKSTIKDLTEKSVLVNDNSYQNMVTITFEQDHNGTLRSDTITLVGEGKLKTKAFV